MVVNANTYVFDVAQFEMLTQKFDNYRKRAKAAGGNEAEDRWVQTNLAVMELSRISKNCCSFLRQCQHKADASMTFIAILVVLETKGKFIARYINLKELSSQNRAH